METIILGFITVFSLSVSLGMQNNHVINVGLRHQNWILVVVICCICDSILLNLGVWGVGGAIAKSRLLRILVTGGGTLFLLWYSFNLLKAAYLGEVTTLDVTTKSPAKKLILTTLAVSLLNPHVYIDTLVLIGGISSALSTNLERSHFLIGALTATIIWFFGLGALASFLAPIFKKESSWRILNLVNGLFMLYIAWYLSGFIMDSI